MAIIDHRPFSPDRLTVARRHEKPKQDQLDSRIWIQENSPERRHVKTVVLITSLFGYRALSTISRAVLERHSYRLLCGVPFGVTTNSRYDLAHA